MFFFPTHDRKMKSRIFQPQTPTLWELGTPNPSNPPKGGYRSWCWLWRWKVLWKFLHVFFLGKVKWINIRHLKRYFLLNMGIFHCHVSFQECTLPFLKLPWLVATQICFIFTPTYILGEMIQFDEHIFQMGWFNHQLVPSLKTNGWNLKNGGL